MIGKTRTEILEAIRGAGARNSRLDFMRICSAHPIDFATANHAFLEGREAQASDVLTAEPDEEAPTGRYVYDFGRCAVAQGWAKFATAQDDHDFGNWASPTELKWLNYREGETTLVEFRTTGEFVDYCRSSLAWYERRDRQRPSLNAGFNEDLKAEFVRLGLADLLADD
jgi:hypothetical protein